MDLREIFLGGCRLDSTGSGQGPVAGCCECGDEPSGSCATELKCNILSLGGGRYSFHSFSTLALDEVNGQRHAPAAL
jgi:hypothetical protein